MRCSRLVIASWSIVASGSMLAFAAAHAAAAIRLAGPFGDHMVIQRDRADVPIWGTAAPGAELTIEVTADAAGEKLSRRVVVRADRDGRFRTPAALPFETKNNPYTIRVSGDGSNITLSDVLAGDVWLCSGQSNMEFGVGGVINRDAELATANRPTIRLYTVPRNAAPEPVATINAAWSAATPETVRPFSAVGYFFGRELNDALDVPIGLIHSSWGGTPAEAWTPVPALKALTDLPEVTKMMTRLALGATPEAQRKFEEDQYAYLKASGRLDPGIDARAAGWATPELKTDDWTPMPTPGDWTAKGVPNGTVWFRRDIDVPAALAGQPLALSLGAIDDLDTTFVNGVQVGSTDWKVYNSYMVPRRYTVPANVVRPGRNVIAVRVFDSGGGAGMLGPANAMVAKIGPRTFPLSGDWLTKQEAAFTPVDGPQPAPPIPPLERNSPSAPATLYNGMIAPLGDFSIKGAIWYQGESNAPRYAEYERLLTTMINAWRGQFGAGDVPFYIVGLANYGVPIAASAASDANAFSSWANVREAQQRVGRTVKNAGTTVTIDIGDPKDIHPKNKQDVGHRLALLALKGTYGMTLVSRGPTVKHVEWNGVTVAVHFDDVGGGLAAHGEALGSFAVAGEDGKFAWADARIEGDAVILMSKDVPAPTKVRYAWADNPTASLFNAEGLPAEPFQIRK